MKKEMRIPAHPILGSSPERERLSFFFDGREFSALQGETIAAALAAEGIRIFRHTRSGTPRGLFCGIGQCTDCVVQVDGVPNIRSCITPVREGMQIQRQRGPGVLQEPGGDDEQNG